MPKALVQYLGPMLTLVFVAGGGWVTLDAVAQQNEELTVRVHEVETKVNQQQVIELKVEQLGTRLEKMEQMLEKTIEVQQRQMANQAAICQATNATCR